MCVCIFIYIYSMYLDMNIYSIKEKCAGFDFD